MSFEFHKYSANGNDFIIIDSLKRDLFLSSEICKQMCDRHDGIGADGVMILRSSDRADFFIEIFNSDGSRANMCSNGLRSCFHFYHKNTDEKKSYTAELANKIYEGKVDKAQSSILLDVSNTNFSIKIDLDFCANYKSHGFIDTGVPHLCLEVEDINSIDVNNLGKTLRNNPYFKHGANINFFEICEGVISIRTYERGIEAETLSCGSGILACAIFLKKKLNLSVFNFRSPGGESIVKFSDQGYEYVGIVNHVFSGQYFRL